MQIYTVSFSGIPDHEAIYIKNSNENTGTLYHIIGSPLEGFTFNIKEQYIPSNSASYVPNSLKYIKDTNLSLNQLTDLLKNIPVQGPIPFNQVRKMKRGIDYGDCRTWVKNALEII